MHLDHRNVGEITEVGDRDLDDLVNPTGRSVAGWLGRFRSGILGNVLPDRNRRCGVGRFGVEPQDQVADGYPVADPDGHLADRSRGGRGNVHGGLVRLQRDQRVLGGHDVAGGHVHLDHRHVGEIAKVGDSDLHVRLQEE